MFRIALIVLFAFKLQQVLTDDDSEFGCGISNLVANADDKEPHPVAPGNFPWYTAIYERTKENEDDWKIICGGTLITPRSVVTAATCLESKKPQNIKVALGKLRFEWNYTEPNEIKKNVTEIRIHANYSGSLSASNIGLLILDSEVLRYNFLCVVDNAENATKTPGFIVGWGLREQTPVGTGGMAPSSEELRYGRSSIMERDVCVQTLKLQNVTIPNDAYCNGTELIPHGIPNMGTGFTFESDGHYYLYGVAAKRLNLESAVGTYTNVSYHYQWIIDHME